jgi:hypothetical protein
MLAQCTRELSPNRVKGHQKKGPAHAAGPFEHLDHEQVRLSALMYVQCIHAACETVTSVVGRMCRNARQS